MVAASGLPLICNAAFTVTVGKHAVRMRKIARAHRTRIENLAREIVEYRVHRLRLGDMIHGACSPEPLECQDEPGRPSVRLVVQ
jgi:hypothetical protein